MSPDEKLDAVAQAIRTLEADASPGVCDAAARALREAFAAELEQRVEEGREPQ